MDRNNPWTTLISAAGAAGAAVGLVYVIGGIVLSLRYEGFGLTGQQAVAFTPREVLLFAGTRSLTIWALLGLALVLALRALPDAAPQAIEAQLRKPRGLLAVAAVVLLLVLLLHVWWPLASLLAVLVLMLAATHWPGRPVLRFLVSAAAIALVAVAYEADRITYQLDWSCVDIAGAVATADTDAPSPRGQAGVEPQRRCGILIGQTDRGVYIGEPRSPHRAAAAAAPYRLVFIPAARVEEAYAEKETARVIQDHAGARRESLPSRLLDIQVR